eukprot:2451083-Alexandrium_andersonii.AAC.1
MSASLVGSEMCIRDSSARGHPSSRDKSAILAWPLHRLHPSRTDLTSMPVSYTHLTLPTICSV